MFLPIKASKVVYFFLVVPLLLIFIPLRGLGQVTVKDKLTIFSPSQSWNPNADLNAEYNFAIYKREYPAGDINGDSLNDFIVSDVARNERTTSVLEDSVYKTAVFWGGNTSGSPDQIIYRKLIPVGDLNNDGYDDAVAVNTHLASPEAEEVYLGSSSGYDKTGSVINGLDTGKRSIIGFTDFGEDGFADILSYSDQSGDITISWGREDPANMTTTTFTAILSANPKRVDIEDVDNDGKQEIVEFSGVLGDGVIQIVEVAKETDNELDIEGDLSLITESYSPLSFTSFTGRADENTRLHLVDNNTDNDYFDILISTGEQNPTYIFKYSIDGLYSSLPTTVSDHQLLPVGDLNQNGAEDFIQKNASETTPSDSIDMVINPQKYGSEGNINYFPARRYGDLNGDGADDVLLGFTQVSGSETVYGRKLLAGSKSGLSMGYSHDYPAGQFKRRVSATEELGDVNMDGVDDFAMVSSSRGRVEIYYGGNTISGTPGQILTVDFTIEGITSGDFTGDGTNDVILLEQAGGSSLIHIYEGGTTLTKVNTIKSLNFQNVDVSHLIGLNNVGDLNEDGTVDFLVGSSQARDTTETTTYLNEAYVFYGGTSISLSPDSTISLDASTNFTGAGESSASLGDINGDGRDDFAVGLPAKPVGDRTGEVKVFLSGQQTPLSLLSDTYSQEFGNDIASGDFNGDGVNDIAVTVSYSVSHPDSSSNNFFPMVHVYHGGAGFDENADQQLALPDFEDPAKNLGANNGALEVISDYNNDGRDELVLTSAYKGARSNYPPNNHAVLYTFNSRGANFLEAPNTMAGLGGQHKIAAGDFDGNNEPDMILSQPNDDNDAYKSSRVFRYPLPLPVNITSARDVPDDQGGQVRIELGGYLTDGSVTLDSLVVRRKADNDNWITSTLNSGSTTYDISVPKTQPTGVDTVDYSYTLKLSAFKEGFIAGSEEISTRARDNINPLQVQNVDIANQDSSKVMRWQLLDIPDLSHYLIYKSREDGQLPATPLDTVESSSYTLPATFRGVQNFVVQARDVNNNFGEHSLPASAVYPKTVGYENHHRWSLIGLPVDATSEQIQTLMDGISSGSIYKYEGVYQQVEKMEAGNGYWVKFSTDKLQEVTGLPFTELTLELQQGWNLVSGVGGELPVADIRDSNNIIIPGTVYSFEQSYSQSDTLRPGRGYWLKSSASGTVTLTHPKLLQTTQSKAKNADTPLTKSLEEAEEKFNKVVISDGENQRTLYFGSELPESVSKESYSLPPLPPGDVFDARFKGGKKLVTKDELYIKLSKLPGSSLSIETNVQSLSRYSRFLIKEFGEGKLLSEYTIDANKRVELSHNETDAVYMAPADKGAHAKSEIPDKFDLKQNYPNPFNPATQIRYMVPERAEVTLEVFNILGKKVATLVDGIKQPGTYEVTFEGSGLASGVYIYRLKAGSYMASRKFILAK